MSKSVSACQQRGDIGGHAEIRSVSKRGHSAKADEKIEAERENPRNQDLAGEVDVEVARKEGWEKKRCGKEGNADPPHAPTRPNRPCGRNARTMIIGKNRMM